MAKKKVIKEKHFKPSAAKSIDQYIIASIITGIATGFGVVLGNIITKSVIKTANYATGGQMPDVVKKEMDK